MADPEDKDMKVFGYEKFQERRKKKNASEIDKEIDAMRKMALRLKKQIEKIVRIYKQNHVKPDDKFLKIIEDYKKLASSLKGLLEDRGL